MTLLRALSSLSFLVPDPQNLLAACTDTAMRKHLHSSGIKYQGKLMTRESTGDGLLVSFLVLKLGLWAGTRPLCFLVGISDTNDTQGKDTMLNCIKHGQPSFPIGDTW